MKRPIPQFISAFVLAAVGLTACSERPAKSFGPTTVDASINGNEVLVRMITTTDGTRCAVMSGSYRGGITCDWAGSRK